MMFLKYEIEKRPTGWWADMPEVPGTGSLGSTREAAVAEMLRKVAAKVERHEVTAALDMFIAEAPPPGQKAFTGAELLAAWKRLPHPGAEWADAVEEVTRSQPSILDEPEPWER